MKKLGFQVKNKQESIKNPLALKVYDYFISLPPIPLWYP